MQPMDLAFRLLKDATHSHDFEDTDDDVQEYFDNEIRPLVLNPNTPRPFAMMSHKILQDKIKPFVTEGIQPDEEMSALLDEYNFRYVENDPEMRGSPVSDRRFSREFQDANKSEPMDLSWRLLKMPVVNTNVPGLRMAYQQKEHLFGYPEYGADQAVIDAYNHPKGMIGSALGLEKYGWKDGNTRKDFDVSNLVASIEEMSPNQYFDHLAEFGQNTEPRMIDGKEYRWPDLGPAHIQSMIDGIKEGQVMGMPALYAGGTAQEGGHRMEALRQMGHGDTPVPVIMYNKGEPMDIAFQLLKY